MNERNLFEKLAAIMAKVGDIPKNGFNSFSKYKYVNKDTLYDYFRAYFTEEGVIVLTSMESIERSQRTNSKGEILNSSVVRKKHTIINLDNPEDRFEVYSGGVGEDKTDKDTYQADTGAMKYFLIDNFFVSGGDSFPGDIEHDSNNDKAPQTTPNLQKLIDSVTKNAAKLPEMFKADVRRLWDAKNELSADKLQEWIDAMNSHLKADA